MAAIGIAWLPTIQLSDELFDYVQLMTAYLVPSICAVYVLAVFWKRNEAVSQAILIILVKKACISTTIDSTEMIYFRVNLLI